MSKLLCAALLTAVLSVPGLFEGSQAVAAPPVKIIITTDIHGYLAYEPEHGRPGLARLKAYLDSLSAGGYLTFLMDSGDAFSGSAHAQVDRGRFPAELMGLAGYRVLTPGNHDFDHNGAENNHLFYSEVLLPLMREHGSPELEVTAANLSYQGRNLPGTARRALIIYDETGEKPDGLRLIVAGAALPQTARPTLAPSIPGYDFGRKEDESATKAAVLAELSSSLADYKRPEDVVLVLSHLGFEDQRNPGRLSGPDLASVPEIDFIADGHSHRAVAPRAINQAVYANGGRYLENFLEISLADGRREMELKTFSDLAHLEPDHALEARLAEFERQHGFKEVIFSLEDGTFSDRGLRENSTPLGRLITRAVAEAAGADVAVQNTGAVRAGFDSGPVTIGRVYDALPFNTDILSYSLSGREIEELFQGYLKNGPGQVQFYGLRIMAWKNDEGGLKIVNLSTNQGQSIDPEQTYQVALSGFLAKGRGENAFSGLTPRNHGDLTTAVIGRLKRFKGRGPDMDELKKDNLLIIESK